MDLETQTRFRLTVWQPYFSRQMLAYSDETEGVTLYGGDGELQRECFAWAVIEDVWAGVTDDAARSGLRERFVNDFQVSLSPSARDMSAFGAYVDEVAAVVHSDNSTWSSSESRSSELGGAPVMMNGLLAFHEQLSWIHETFRDVPGASVSVR